MDEEPEIPWWKFNPKTSEKDRRLVFIWDIVVWLFILIYWPVRILRGLSDATLEHIQASPVFGPWLLYTHDHLVSYTTFLIIAAILAVFGIWSFRTTEEWSNVKKVLFWFSLFLFMLFAEAALIGVTHRSYASHRKSTSKDDSVTLKQVFPKQCRTSRRHPLVFYCPNPVRPRQQNGKMLLLVSHLGYYDLP